MGRPRSAEPLSEQVLVRLSEQQLEALQALGILQGASSSAEVLRSLLERELDRLGGDPLMASALDVLRARAALREAASHRLAEVIPLRS